MTPLAFVLTIPEMALVGLVLYFFYLISIYRDYK